MITALPTSTIRALGACQALHDPATVIKELIDNSLDAYATSISIEISNNTVDSIQVRDNGRGIPPEDRVLVARPHCTSKIGGEEDLRNIGGSSLGFRGEALSSVAEMSGSLTISTRVEGEEVAIALKINKQGEVVGQDRASLPVGTTIKIGEFVKAYPVRNQNALKNSDKCLKTIKQTLRSYAFARPHVRFSLRVLKAKSGKSDWTYAPKPGGGVEDAALKIVGSACASQCIFTVVEEQGFTLRAFLPKSDATVDKISNIGQFLSIDSRPVSSTRGTCKQLVKIFRDALKRAGSSFEGVKEPFLYLDIACPRLSYDANVEPAKDDVLFENPEIVLGVARRLFDGVYPVKESVQPVELPSESTNDIPPPQPRPTLDDDGFFTSLELPHDEYQDSRSTVEATSGLIPEEALRYIADTQRDRQDGCEEPSMGRLFRSNMYGCDEEDLDLIDERPPTGRTEAEIEELRQARQDVNLSNPWMIAKMHAASRRPMNLQEKETLQSDSTALESSPMRPKIRNGIPSNPYESLGPPTPRPSSPLLSSQRACPSEPALNVSAPANASTIGAPTLPPPHAVLTQLSTLPSNVEPMTPRRESPAYDYTLSSQTTQPPAGTPLLAIPDKRTKPPRPPRKQLQQTYINKPFIPPLKDQPPREKVWFDHLEGNGTSKQRYPKKRQQQHGGSDGLVRRGELGDLMEDPHPLSPPKGNRDMRDFLSRVDLTATSPKESRKRPRRLAKGSEVTAREFSVDEDSENHAPGRIQGGPDFVRANELAVMDADHESAENEVPRPTKRRKTSESQVLRQLSINSQPRHNDSEDMTTNPTAPVRRRRTTDGMKARRTKSSLLPLERVPVGQGTHHIVSSLSTAEREISRLAGTVDQDKSFLGWNREANTAHDAYHSLRHPAEMRELTARLKMVLVNRFPSCEMVQDFDAVVDAALSARVQRVTNDDAL